MLIPFDYLFMKYQIKSTGVLHLGAHWGEEGEAYAAAGVKTVIWIEALEDAFGRLAKHVKELPGSHHCIRACVSDTDGKEVTFNIASNQGQSSSIFKFGTHAKEHPTVKYIRKEKMITARVDSLLETWGLKVGPGWFLNADLQGAELLALKGMGDLLWRFDHAYIEVNDRELYQGCPLTPEIDDYLADFGLSGMEAKMTGAGWGDKYYKRNG